MVTLAGRSCVARQEPYIPGALSILPGTVPGRVRGSGHMVPTYFRRELRDRVLQRRSRLRTLLCLLSASVQYVAAQSGSPPVLENGIARRFAGGRRQTAHASDPIESRATQRSAGQAGEAEREAAQCRGQCACEARPADRDHARPYHFRLFADPQRDRSPAADGEAGQARRAACAADGDRARQIADLPQLQRGRPPHARHTRHSRAVAGGGRSGARHHAGAARSLRCDRSSHRLWRRVLRLQLRTSEKAQARRWHRARLRGAGNRFRSGLVARRAARLCANGKAGVRFPERLNLRILFVGDVVGRAGRAAVNEHLPGLVRDWALDLVVVNGENAAGGFGITEAIYQELCDVGADAITLGNHAWDQREALVFIERAPRLVRPANFPKGTPGRGSALVETRTGKRALVINAMGRVFMTPLDDPFASIARELEACPLREAVDAIVVDFHCEATSEKQGIGFFCDGRVSLVVGTHTHVPTA